MVAKKSRLKSRRAGAYGSMQDQVYDYLLKGIKNNLYQMDDILPSIRDVAKHFGNSITPVNQALRKLESEGYVERIHGVGVRVRSLTPTTRSVRTKPVIHFLSMVKNIQLLQTDLEKIETAHSEILQEWLLHHLSINRDIHFSLASCEGVDDHTGFLRLLQDTLDLRPSAVVFACMRALQKDELVMLEKIHAQGTRVVYFGSHDVLPYADCVRSNFAQGQYDLATYLLNKGYKRPLRIVTSFKRLYEKFKQDGFERALLDEGYSPENISSLTYVLPESFFKDYKENSSFWVKPFEEILKRQPDAIMFQSDASCGHAKVALYKMTSKVSPILCVGYDLSWNYCINTNQNYLNHYRNDDPYIIQHILSTEHPPISVDRDIPSISLAMAELVVARVLDQLPPEPQMRLVPQRVVLPPNA